MATLLNYTHPALRIFIPNGPAAGTFRVFANGRLDIEDNDPAFETVMAEAVRNPNIIVTQGTATCPWCAESFTGSESKAKAELSAHEQDKHLPEYLARTDAEAVTVRNALLKDRAGFACDVCRPAQVYGTEENLQEHIRVLHTAKPVLDVEGNIVEGATPTDDAGAGTTTEAAKTPHKRQRRPGEVGEVPAARSKA